MYCIELTRQAEKAFRHLSKAQPKLAKKLATAIEQLKTEPQKGIPLRKELKGLYKYRIGSYRLIYQIKRRKLVLIVIDIGHRKEIYR